MNEKKYLKLLVLILSFNAIFAQSTTDNLKTIKKYLVTSGINPNDISDLKIQSEAFSKSMNVNAIYAIQQYNGIPIRNAIGTFAIRDGKVVHFSGKYINDISVKTNTKTPAISVEGAVRKASSILKLGNAKNTEILVKKSKNKYLLSKGNISIDNIPAKLVYDIKDGQLILAWELSIHTLGGDNLFTVTIDTNNGTLISKEDMILKCSFDDHYLNKSSKHTNKNESFNIMIKEEESSMIMGSSYRVFKFPLESPNHGARTLVFGQENLNASPFGWHDTDGIAGADFTTTQGNNVFATENLDGDREPGIPADGSTGLIFDYPLDLDAPYLDFQNASITNLFYANNVLHDVWYQYGFDEAAGNFQVNNYGKEGEGNDSVLALCQDGASKNNATFQASTEGEHPIMSMFLWNPVGDFIPNFTVNNTHLTGNYKVRISDFGPVNTPPPLAPAKVTGDLEIPVFDRFKQIDNDVKDKIVVVRRKECPIPIEEVINECQRQQAIAVLVVNNVPGDFTLDGNIFGTSIPAVSINQADGEALIKEMALNTINVSLSSTEGDGTTGADGSFDNGIIAHEYGHGISFRLTGGPFTNCLFGKESMREGWSDWFALMMTIESTDIGADARGIATYALEQPISGRGYRPFPYSTDMIVNPVTYTDVSDEVNFPRSHGVGSIWASILWDMTWAFIDRDGFDPDLYEGTGGNNLAMQLVIDGLKLQPCSPGFEDGRDGILAAADLLPNSDANTCLIWDVFARRGLGYSADQGTSSSRIDQTVAFDLPPSSEINCERVLEVEDFEETTFRVIPNPSQGNFVINISQTLGDSIIRIADINGRVVFEKDIILDSSYNVNTTGIRTGIYILQITNNTGKNFITKIIIQ